MSQKKSPLGITLLLLTVCYTFGNLFELNMNSGSIFIFLCENNLTKTIAQINDCLFTYMKFNAMDHALQHVPQFRSAQRMVRLCV